MNKYKTLGSTLRNMSIRSTEIVPTGGKYVLKINNQFIGIFDNYSGAQEVLDSVACRGGNRAGAIDCSTFINDKRLRVATDLSRRFGVVKYISGTTGADNIWNGWSAETISFYVGQPLVGGGTGWQGARAFGANVNPTSVNFTAAHPTGWNANPSVLTGASATSPWHNILYEHLIEDYRYGVRSFLLYMPFGAYSPTTNIWMCSPIQMEDTFTQTAAGNYWQAPARWKGFWEAVKQLMEGTFPDPINVNSTTRPRIVDPLDITIYFNGCNSYKTYRDQMFAVWNGAGGGAAGDAALKSLLDRFIARVLSMKPAKNKGQLTCIFDVACLSATPSNISLWRGLDDPPANGDRAAQSYISDFCELADYYVVTALQKEGIDVRVEAAIERHNNFARVTDEQSPFGTTGPVGPDLYNAWGLSGGDAAWKITVNPDLNINTTDFMAPTAEPYTLLLQGSFLGDETKIRFGHRSKVFNGASVRDLFLNPPTTGDSVVYSPHYAMQHVYIIADLMQDFMMRSGNTVRNWKDRRILKGFNVYFVDPYFLCGHLMPFRHFADAVPGPANKNTTQTRYTWFFGNVNYCPDTWNLATFQANPGAYNQGYWTAATKAAFITNIRGFDPVGGVLLLSSWVDWLGNINDMFNIGAKPPGSVGAQPEWGTDSTYNSIVSSQMRTP